MILGNSNHPVEIKKITVKIWKLRDEIEHVLAAKLEFDQSDLDPKEKVKDVEEKYSFLSKPPAEVIPLNQEKNDEEAEGEEEGDEADADADAENSEPESDEDKEETPDEEENKEESEDDGKDSESEEKSDDADSKTESKTDDATENEKKEGDQETDQDSAITAEQDLQENVFKIHETPELAADKVSSGICFLADIDMFYVHFFSEKHFIAGQTIVIEFLVPAKFNLIAEVTRSVVYNLKSRIISPARPPYRLSAKFRLERSGDRSSLRRFLTSVVPDIPVASKKKAKAAEEEDDFDDLDLD